MTIGIGEEYQKFSALSRGFASKPMGFCLFPF